MKLAIVLFCAALLAGCASVFDAPTERVPYGQVTMEGKSVLVQRMGVDCSCPAIPAPDSWLKSAVLEPRDGCNNGVSQMCVRDDRRGPLTYRHERWELTTGGRHDPQASALNGCYRITVAGGEFHVGDYLCPGNSGDYRIPK